MSEQQQNGARRPEQVNAILRTATEMHALINSRDEEKRRADHYEAAYTKAESENIHLREMLDRMMAERDGYFQDATVLRSQFMSIGNAFTDAVKSMMARQTFTPTTSAKTSPVDDGAPVPRFLREGPRDLDESPQRMAHQVDLEQFGISIGGRR